MPRPVHRLRHLQAFLARQPFPRDRNYGEIYLIALGLPILALILTMGAKTPFQTALIGLGTIAILLALLKRLGKTKEQPILTWTENANNALQELRDYNYNNSLEERTDPDVGNALNSCCEAYLESRAILDRPEWKRAEGVKLDAKVVAEAALSEIMGEALVIGLSGIRPKGQRRDVFTKRMQSAVVKEPILTDLNALSDELEELLEELQTTTQIPALETDNLREAIHRISEIRAAEEELHSRA